MAWKSSLLLSVCCILIIHTFTIFAEDESENFFTEEKLIPLKKTQRYSLYDVYNNDKTFLNYAYDISMMDVDINSRHRRQSEGSGSGDRIDECADQNLNNCTGDHVQCIDLYEGFECGCDSPYEWNSEKEACFLNECGDSSLHNCTGDHVKCIDLDEGFKCGCDEPYEWNAKEKACFWKLYPYGTDAQATLLSKQDDIAERLVVSSGIPFYDTKHRTIYIGSNGVVSFGMYYNPFIMEFPPRYRSVLCPYCADVDTSVSTSGFISYGLYDKNRDNEQVTTILKRANDDIKEYTNEGTFDASQVLIVTWYKVPKYYSEHPDSEIATFQTVIITDGETSYALFIYNELKWKSSYDRIIIGYGENWNTRTISASGTRGAYFRRNIGGIRGQTGFYVFRVGYVQSFSQKCMNWYQSQWNEYNDNMWKYYDLPECPCSVRRLRFDRRWRSIWGRSWGHQCTTLNYNFDFLPKGKSCCYYNGRFISSGVYAGYSYRYHQWYDWISHILSDIRGKYYCCTRSNLCHLFYSIRPTGMCSSTSLFLQGGGYGDPHIATLDGRTFIFNGHGEYTLISIADGQMKMDLQARTGRADTANGTLTSATIFTAFAAKENNKSKFHVELSPDKTKMYVFGNDEDGTFKDYTKLFEDNDPNNTNSFITDKTLSSLTITKGENDELIVLFPSGNSFTIKKGPKLLTIDASIHTKFKEKTSGLLGNFDGNKDNDFIFPSGTTLSNNASEEDIFHYGQTWMITPETSVMMYPRRENANDYNFRNFTPMFLDQADPELKKKAIEICGGVEKIACVFDYVATGSSDIAKATDDKTIETDESQAELANSIPVINNSSTRSLDITKSADAVQFQVSGTDADNDVLVYEFTGKTPEGVTLVLNNATGAGSITATSMDSMSLSFVVKDAKGVYSSVHQIVARVCDGCNEHGTCIFSESRSSVDTVETNDAFIVASCNCTRGWTGDNCSVDYDACEDKPCITGQNCTDLTPEQEVALDRGYNCTACPTGFEEKDGKCADVDECNGTTHGCAQLCENSPGSYSCLCNVGYRQDEKLCHDIDECELGTHGCDQTCNNNNGSYSCSCNYGFELNTDNKTCNQTVSDCNVKTNGKNCTYGCQVTSDNITYICSCKSGYTLNSDGFNCDNINECERNICTQKCSDTIGSYVCSCFDGFKLADDKRSCEACTDLSYGPECDLTCDCGDRASECHSVLGCKCNDGWKGTKCDENVDECEEDQNICGDNMLCKDTVGSYMCLCLEGYEKNGTSCVDINECDTEANNCKQECTNVVGSFSCSCRSGFQGDNCTDVDECEADQHDCQQICSNVQGSYNCECQFGYRLKEDRKSCEQVKDVCTLFPNLHCSLGCSVDEQNQAYCFCNTGFRLASDDETCLDINECTTTDTSLRHKCSHTCINKEAGYDCSCPTGYKLENDLLTCKACDSSHWGDTCVNTCACGIGASSCNSETGCVCKTGWRGIHCNEDINECNGDVTCPTNSVCDNTPGSYRCKCNDGYRMSNNSITCDNIDECTEKLHNCDQICTDNPGSFVCSCKSGFVWTESTKECKDIDECSTQTYECEHNCINTIGGYDCSCRSGFRLNITNRKECLVETACQNLADCDENNGGCQNTGTGELCFCNKGFTLNADNKTCDDIKECDANPSPCRAHGKCNEMEGSYNCTCEDGYKLQSDKVSCRECDEGSYGTECAQNCSCVAANTESCNKTNGVCTCKTGWNGTNCEEDIDECSAANPPECGNNGHCRNVDGSYFCDCDAGFFLLKTACKACDEKHWGLNCAKTCNCTVHAISCNASDGNCACKTGWEGTSCETDIDECSNTTICSGIANTDCHNKDGSFSCDCKAGYKKKTDGTCEDVDECLESTDNCSVEHKICNNTVGGFTCGACAAGYESSSGDNCTACDETHWGLNCTNNCTCTDHAESCSGTDGTCTCKTGWEGTNCETDIDECSVNTTICSGIANTDCHNMNGSYSCECQSDYPKHSDGTCKACDGKHWGQDCANNCTCTDNASNCSATDGNCTCKTGWEGTNCETDIDECSVNTTICSGIANTDCHNMNGSYSCDCQSDYPKHSDGTCKACDDKHWGQDCAKNCTCTDNASNCSATDGNCICKTGWEGTNCETDIDECSVNTTICSGIANTDCHNMDGSYSCDCQSGYTKNTDGACKDINECLTVSHGCEQQCLNTVGGYKCYCSAGYIISPKDDKQCDETKTYKAVIILEYNLSNASTFEFKQDVAKIKDGLSVYFKSKIDGFIEVIINKITKGSAVVDYTIMINSVLEKNSAGSFTQAVLELAKTGNITIGTSVNILRQQINNKDLTSDTTPCSLLEFIDPCSSGQKCEVVEGVAKCNIIQTEDNLPMIIGLSVGIPLFFIILAAIVLVVYLCLRSKRRSDDSFSDDDDIYHDEAFRSVFASSLPRRSHYGPSNLAYQMDSDRFKSFNKDGVRLPRFKTEQMNLNTTVQRDQPEDHRDETPRGEYSWDLLKNVLPSEPLEIKRPKISLFSNPVSPSFKQSTQINEDLS